jgi:hypothetical protein
VSSSERRVLKDPESVTPRAVSGSSSAEVQTVFPEKHHLAMIALLILVAFTLLAHWVQTSGGSWGRDLSAEGDEAAHYVTGRMIFDYLKSDQWLDPKGFATAYYANHPKVAIGHWPPGYYVLQAAWYAIVGPSLASISFLQAVTVGAGAALLFLVSWTLSQGPVFFRLLLAGLTPVMFISLRLTQTYVTRVMTELIMVILTIGFLYFFARFLDQQRKSDWWITNLFLFAATFTKPNGFFLSLTMAAALVIYWKRIPWKRFWFWAIAILATIPGVAWTLIFFDEIKNGVQLPTNVSYVGDNAALLIESCGWILVLIALVAPIIHFAQRRLKGMPPLVAVSWLSILASFLFYAFVAKVIDMRHYLLIAPSIILIFVWVLSNRVRLIEKSANRNRETLIFASLLLLGCWTIPVITEIPGGEAEHLFGARQAAIQITRDKTLASRSILVSSLGHGEGALIAALLDQETASQRRVFRATKVFAKSDWTGLDYRLKTESTPVAFRKLLDDINVDLVAIDLQRSLVLTKGNRHHSTLIQAVTQNRGWRRLTFSNSPGGPNDSQFAIYQKVRAAGGQLSTFSLK